MQMSCAVGFVADIVVAGPVGCGSSAEGDSIGTRVY
jgi:hypothetical protein